MSSVAVDPISDLQSQLEAAAADPRLDPAERALKLRALRSRLADLLGAADELIGRTARAREAAASDQARLLLWARSNADSRAEMLREGLLDEEQADAAGLLSHAELDRLSEEGLLFEAIAGIARQWDPTKHMRAGHGRFGDEGGGMGVGHAGAPPGPIDSRYQRYFKHSPDASIVHVSRLRPTRQDTPEHVQKAADNLERASKGLMEKRKPLDAVENGDGTLGVIDGNSTLQALASQGLTHFPVRIKAGGNADDEAVKRVADELGDRAEKSEPQVTAVLKRAVADAGGQLAGLEFRLKTRESLARKVKSKQAKYPGMAANKAGGRINDALRYTAVFDPADYMKGVSGTVSSLQAAGFKPWMTKNYWGGGDDYNGYHVVMAGPDGGNIELQFHTPDSLKAKQEQNHPLYEKFRSSADPHDRWRLWQQMVENAARVPEPAGAQQLPGMETHATPPAAG